MEKTQNNHFRPVLLTTVADRHNIHRYSLSIHPINKVSYQVRSSSLQFPSLFSRINESFQFSIMIHSKKTCNHLLLSMEQSHYQEIRIIFRKGMSRSTNQVHCFRLVSFNLQLFIISHANKWFENFELCRCLRVWSSFRIPTGNFSEIDRCIVMRESSRTVFQYTKNKIFFYQQISWLLLFGMASVNNEHISQRQIDFPYFLGSQFYKMNLTTSKELVLDHYLSMYFLKYSLVLYAMQKITNR